VAHLHGGQDTERVLPPCRFSLLDDLLRPLRAHRRTGLPVSDCRVDVQTCL
jgi:hypothetical protein